MARGRHGMELTWSGRISSSFDKDVVDHWTTSFYCGISDEGVASNVALDWVSRRARDEQEV
jgi:hypothetical protein